MEKIINNPEHPDQPLYAGYVFWDTRADFYAAVYADTAEEAKEKLIDQEGELMLFATVEDQWFGEGYVEEVKETTKEYMDSLPEPDPLRRALKMIKARIEGAYDDVNLMEWGPLGTDPLRDIEDMLNKALAGAPLVRT
ncbi:hypothetical protein TK90_2661 (plasmid) [Thioalkalivibrio sp. K90mix]|uniref:hypothetical protein n=1 Tax=Thioalkalivibrio sp. (strain K90mix) TaxID=396595 RepID=UPI000195A3B1|nr:hypothetical protein [Thioalkalivibrio sp. K90mix]ADC73148.1 hypothetical protein TK90_2661 [Thioalkalivibrio sp. K90mix]